MSVGCELFACSQAAGWVAAAVMQSTLQLQAYEAERKAQNYAKAAKRALAKMQQIEKAMYCS